MQSNKNVNYNFFLKYIIEFPYANAETNSLIVRM